MCPLNYQSFLEKGKTRSSRLEVICRKSALKNFTKFTGKQLCWGLFFDKVAGRKPPTLFKKTPTQLSSSEFCEIFKNTFFTEHLPATAS